MTDSEERKFRELFEKHPIKSRAEKTIGTLDSYTTYTRYFLRSERPLNESELQSILSEGKISAIEKMEEDNLINPLYLLFVEGHEEEADRRMQGSKIRALTRGFPQRLYSSKL